MMRPMRCRWLWAVPVAVAVATAVMAFGPYWELCAATSSHGGAFDEAPKWNFAHARAHLVEIGEHGRGLYRAHFWWDLPFLLANAIALWVLIATGLSRTKVVIPPLAARLMLALPLLAGAGDLIENLAVSRLVAQAQEPSATVLAVAASATTIKLGCFMASVAAAVFAVGLWLAFARRECRVSSART